METIFHPLAPIFDTQSRVLILGTMPSTRSRAEGFYYAHPQNRFWRVLSDVLGEEQPSDNDARREMLLRNHIALWDVLKRCEISGAADSSIRSPVANDFSIILLKADIRAVFTTGKTAARLYHDLTHSESLCLPSPSPANCAVPYEKLKQAYAEILLYI